jgi:hypothetical protein
MTLSVDGRKIAWRQMETKCCKDANPAMADRPTDSPGREAPEPGQVTKTCTDHLPDAAGSVLL